MTGAQVHSRAVRRLAVEQRRAEVIRLWAQGRTQREIATLLGVSRALVAKDCAAVLEATREAAAEHAEIWRAKELAKLEVEEREIWAAWERSKRDKRKITRKRGGTSGAEASYQREGRLPAPEYMARLQAIHERRAKLLGLDAPSQFNGVVGVSGMVATKAPQVGAPEQEWSHEDWEKMALDHLAKVSALRAPVTGAEAGDPE